MRNVWSSTRHALERRSGDKSSAPTPTWAVKQAMTRAVSGVNVYGQTSG